MKLTHIYRIKPTTEQVAIMETWLEMLRRHYNYALGQRFDWLRRTRCPIDRCSLVCEPIGEISDRFPSYNFQAGELKTTKELFPIYKEIHAEVQQQNLKRLDKAWDRWMKPDLSGKRAGRPRFKKSGEMRSFTFPRINCQLALDTDENAAQNILYKGLIAVGLTVTAYRRLSGCTPVEVGMPNSDVRKLPLYS